MRVDTTQHIHPVTFDENYSLVFFRERQRSISGWNGTEYTRELVCRSEYSNHNSWNLKDFCLATIAGNSRWYKFSFLVFRSWFYFPSNILFPLDYLLIRRIYMRVFLMDKISVLREESFFYCLYSFSVRTKTFCSSGDDKNYLSHPKNFCVSVVVISLIWNWQNKTRRSYLFGKLG